MADRRAAAPRGRTSFLEQGQDHPNGAGMAVEQIHEFHQVRVLPDGGHAHGADDFLQEKPALLRGEAGEAYLAPLHQQILLGPVHDDHLAPVWAALTFI